MADTHKCGPDCWYVAKTNGRWYRMRNRCTGAWAAWEKQRTNTGVKR